MAANQDSSVVNLPVSNASETIEQQVNPSGTGLQNNQKVNNKNKKNRRKKSAKVTSTDPSPPSDHVFRFQVKLEKGFFTNELKEDLIRNLNDYLYNLPPDSFIPSFNGNGLRYGKIWFSPEDERSCIWLKETLLDINEKAANEFKFCIQPYCLKQNKICLNIPWSAKDNLTTNDVMRRLHFQNPNYLINLWKVIQVKVSSPESRLVFCSADQDSIELLQKQKFRLNYGFQKVLARALLQNKSAQSKAETS